jgi:hypothetical protein
MRLGWKPGRPPALFLWSYQGFSLVLASAFFSRDYIWASAVVVAGLFFCTCFWGYQGRITISVSQVAVRPHGFLGACFSFPLSSLVSARVGRHHTIDLIDERGVTTSFGPWQSLFGRAATDRCQNAATLVHEAIALTGSSKRPRNASDKIIETVNNQLRTSDLAATATTDPLTKSVAVAVGPDSNRIQSSSTRPGRASRRRVFSLSACYVSFPVAVFMTGWSGRWLVAAISSLLLIGTLHALAHVALHPRPNARRVLLALVLGAVQVAAWSLAAPAGEAAFRRDLIDRLGEYETVVSALEAKAANRAGAHGVLLVDPHPGIAWAELDKTGRPRLALRHSLRQQELVFAAGSKPPARDEQGRCRQRLSPHWYWYLGCCSKS